MHAYVYNRQCETKNKDSNKRQTNGRIISFNLTGFLLQLEKLKVKKA